ncbi:MAG: NAD(P)H-hydrate dehydratase, partial [Marinosulfonomonas sp.]|nr:NAD(P)H-hydrate dehydratase [Marinosulfonomonas sp.]
EWPELAKTDHRAVVLCGPGNNGGDGFVVARLLHEWGWQVEVFLYGDAGKLPPDAKVNYQRWREMGKVLPFDDWKESGTWQCELLVDALFGTGLKRGLREFGDLFWNMEDMIECFAIEQGHAIGRPAIVAVDIPSGVCADSGRSFPHDDNHHRFAASAHLTVSFHSAKIGHYLDTGPEYCGRTVVKEIGLKAPSNWRRENCKKIVGVCGPGHPSWLRKDSDDHKYTHGHALILSGGPGKGGAARLAARGALRIGAGLVSVGCSHTALPENAAQLTAIMLREIDSADVLAQTLKDKRINALCLGPGLGKDQRERALVQVALESRMPLVLDADALSILLFDEADALFGKLHENCVLTPHAGEFARLFPDIAEKLNAPATKGPAYSKVDATREAAARAGCVVLFKGADTVIADPDGGCSINSAHYERSAPWLATAGSGDVLAGFITGLLARGFASKQAAETAGWLHVECALKFGPGLIAEDLPEQLPAVFRELGMGL